MPCHLSQTESAQIGALPHRQCGNMFGPSLFMITGFTLKHPHRIAFRSHPVPSFKLLQ